jgi:hypothetical protein
MPYTQEERAEYRRAYYLANKDKALEQAKEYNARPEVKARKKAYNEQYNLAKKEQVLQQKREYHRNNPQKMRIKSWKERGLVEDEDYTFEQIYELYLQCKTCDDCDKDLTGKDAAGRRLVFMDHCHATGKFRGFVCNRCNQKRAVKDKLDKL